MADTLPTQHTTAQTARWSIFSDNQLRDTLETGLAAALGTGVLSKGRVTKTAALAVELETGTVLFCEGVALTLSVAAAYSGLTAGQTNYLWGLVTRTARDRNTLTALDTWALVLSHNTTGVAPTALSIPLAVISIPASAITGIDDAPAGKYLPVASRLGATKDTVALGDVAAIDSGYQVQVAEQMTVRGLLVVRGHLYVRGVS
jgi:hypothetical protein